MLNDRTKNATRNIFWGILNKVVTLGMPFITRTVMIYSMGMQYVGLGSLFTSVLHVLSFAELGIGSALVFSMYKPMAEEDEKKVCALLNFYKKAYRVIGISILLVGLVIIPFLPHLIAGEIPDNINVYLLFGIYLLNNVLGYFLFAYKQSLFTASQRSDRISRVGIVLHLLSGIAQITVLITLHSYYAYVVIIPIITIVNNLIICYLADRYYPQYKCEGDLQREELSSIKKLVGGMVFQKIGGIVLTSVDTIVISSFLGLTSLALYQNYHLIITSIFGFLSIIMQSIVASVGNSVALESIEKNYFDFRRFNFVYIWIVSCFSICLLCMYQPFMKLWVGEANMFDLEMVVLFAIYFFTHKWCDMLYVYQEASGIWWETKFVPLLASVVNLVINIVLVQIIGLPGIVISTIIAVVFIYDTGYSYVLFRTYFKSVNKGFIEYWKNQLKLLIVTVIVAFSVFFICQFVKVESNVINLIIVGCISFIFSNLFFIVVYHRTMEYRQSKAFFRKLLLKRIRE